MNISACLKHAQHDAQRELLRVMETAGWELQFVDLDFSKAAPCAEIQAHRFDGLCVHARVDRLGRATMERFMREKSLCMPQNQKGTRPLTHRLDDIFLGRQHFDCAGEMMQNLHQYFCDNALNQSSLQGMRSAWNHLMPPKHEAIDTQAHAKAVKATKPSKE